MTRFLFFLCCCSFSFLLHASEVLDKSLSQHIKYNPQTTNIVGLISINDRSAEINQGTWLYVRNALEYYKKIKPIFIILQLNTPGGEAFSALQISDALKELDTQYGIPVIAFIDNWAMSAGAMLAYSARFIAVAKDGAMGAAEPINISEGGEAKTASEKVNSALRTDFANRAAFYGRNPFIAEAMVDKDVILVQRQGKVIKLDNEDQILKGGEHPDVIISLKGKLLTLTSEQLIKLGVADLLLPPQKIESLTSEELTSGKYPASKHVLFHYPFFKSIPHAVIDAYQIDWKTRFFMWLASPVISSMLLLGLVVSIYMEMNSPGLGLAATVGAVCLFLIILSSFSLQVAGWLELIFLFIGIAILLAEFFVLPTFGLLGFIGILFFIIGLFGLMLPGASSVHFDYDSNSWNAAGEAVFHRLAWLCGAFVAAFVVILFLSRYITPRFIAFKRFVLSGNEQEGYLAVDNPKELPPVGSSGEVLATLRPAGKVVINDQIYEAITSGSYVEKGEKIIVKGTDGGALIVAKEE